MSADEEPTRPILGEVCALYEGGRCLPVEIGPAGALSTVGQVTDWQSVLHAVAAIRFLGDYAAGEWTGLYEVVSAGDRTVQRYLVAE